jgi:hypothetical protein
MTTTWLQVMGAFAYAGIVGLAIVWAAVGIAYCRAGRGNLVWRPFIVSMIAFSLFFVGLAIVVSEASWIDRYWMMVFNRTTGMVAAGAGWIYTVATLHSEYRWGRGKQ